MTKEELRSRVQRDYNYHRDAKKHDLFAEVRRVTESAALKYIEQLPTGRELELALMKLEEAAMHASAAIGRMAL